MRFGVATGELTSAAAAVREDASGVTPTAPLLRSSAADVGAWTVGRASTAARALFDTLAVAAAELETGLERLGDQVEAAAGAYDAAEGTRLRPQ